MSRREPLRAQMQLRRPPRLRTVLTLPFVLLLALTSLLTIWLFWRTNQRATARLTDEIRVQVTARVSAYLLRITEEASRLSAQNAALLRQGLVAPERTEELQLHLWEQLRDRPSIAFAFVGTPRGGAVGAGRLADGSLAVDATAQIDGFGPVAGARSVWATDGRGARLELVQRSEGFDARRRPWFRDAIARGGPGWSEPYVLFSEKALAIAVSEPVFAPDSGELLAVVGVDLSLHELGNFLRRFDLPGEGRLMLVDRAGRLVATSDPAHGDLRRSADDEWSRRPAAASGDELLRAAAAAVEASPAGWSGIRQPTHLTARPASQELLIDVAPFDGSPGLDWLLVSVVPREAFTATISRELRWTASFSLFALALALLLGVALSRRISRTAEQLSDAASRVGGRTSPAPMPASGIRELDELAASFDEMSAQVGATFDELERRVSERTLELEQARQRADDANRAKSEFLSRVSHELRTPLASIRGYLDLLAQGVRGHRREPELVEALETVAASSAQLQALVDDLLDYQRLQAGRLPVARSSFDLERLLQRLVRTLEPQARGKGLELELIYQLPRHLRVTTDRRRLEQILANLVGNAVKYTLEGSVMLTACRGGAAPGSTEGDVLLTVRDTGPGIPEERLAELFQPFTRLGHQPEAGFVLGLAISRELSEALGFELTVVSELGSGTEFRILLAGLLEGDLAGTSPAHLSTTQVDLAIAGGPMPARVLVADDSPELRRLVELQLDAWGIATVGVASGDQALLALEGRGGEPGGEGEGYDAALLDWQMPGSSGLEVARRLRRDGIELPLAAITASALPDQRAECLDAGFDEVFTKPIDFARLRSWLQGIGARRADRAEPGRATGQAVPAGDHPVVDVGSQVELLRQRMAAQLPAQIAELRRTARGDQEAYRRALHRMAGTVGSYGFTAVQAALEDLEQCAAQRREAAGAWRELEQRAREAAGEARPGGPRTDPAESSTST
ncbi:MAG: response regulator [Acidobacteria bacterium]|nr:MAG: response regulator [Acidobacteriota bacterium]